MDASEALKLDGVDGYFGVDDLPGNNKPGLQLSNMNIPDDTTIFADKKVQLRVRRNEHDFMFAGRISRSSDRSDSGQRSHFGETGNQIGQS